MEPNPSPESNPQRSAEPQLGESHPLENFAKPKGWYTRGYLPHFDAPNTLQSITFRLADSLPKSKVEQLKLELQNTPPERRDLHRRKRIEEWLDSGYGCCALAHPRVAQIMKDTLLKWDGDRYKLIAWVIMPNHVHVLIRTRAPLAKIIQSWKSYTGRWALKMNEELELGIPTAESQRSAEPQLGANPSEIRAFWMREYWDRYVRDGKHFDNLIHYIECNPVKANLCQEPKKWKWTSATLA